MNPLLAYGQFSEPVSELKFTLSRPLAAEIREWARLHMDADPNGGGPNGDIYTIHSLYLDTQNFDVLRRNGSFGRGKYRIRRYGSSDLVFLERKMKANGLVSKRRTAVTLAELPCAAEPSADRRWSGFWFHRRTLARELQTVCQIEYSRTARMSPSGKGTFRLTLDDGISTCLANGLSFEPCSEPVAFSGDRVILEMKFRGGTSLLAQKLIEEFKLASQPSSKYRIAGALLGFTSDLIALDARLRGNSERSLNNIEVPQFA